MAINLRKTMPKKDHYTGVQFLIVHTVLKIMLGQSINSGNKWMGLASVYFKFEMILDPAASCLLIPKITRWILFTVSQSWRWHFYFRDILPSLCPLDETELLRTFKETTTDINRKKETLVFEKRD